MIILKGVKRVEILCFEAQVHVSNLKWSKILHFWTYACSILELPLGIQKQLVAAAFINPGQLFPSYEICEKRVLQKCLFPFLTRKHAPSLVLLKFTLKVVYQTVLRPFERLQKFSVKPCDPFGLQARVADVLIQGTARFLEALSRPFKIRFVSYLHILSITVCSLFCPK